MENKNSGIKVLVIVPIILLVGMAGYIAYDKALSKNNETYDEQYSVSDFSGKVFNSKTGEPQYFLTLWDDGKYMYTNDNQVEETLGEYKIQGDKIKLTYLYTIDRGENKTSSADDTAKKVTGTKELKISSTNELVDETVNIKLQPVNQSANEGGNNFNTVLSGYKVNENASNSAELCNNTANQKSNLLDREKLEKYKNNDGVYGIQKQFSETNYHTKLNLIGDVEVCLKSDCKKITNVSNVIDILQWTIAGMEEEQKIIILQDNGDLYIYAYKDYKNNNFTAQKMNNITNVERIIEFHHYNAPVWGAFAITRDNEYIEIYRESI